MKSKMTQKQRKHKKLEHNVKLRQQQLWSGKQKMFTKISSSIMKKSYRVSRVLGCSFPAFQLRDLKKYFSKKLFIQRTTPKIT